MTLNSASIQLLIYNYSKSDIKDGVDMPRINPKSSSQFEWYSMIEKAKIISGYNFSDSVQHYLVLTLRHFTTNKDIASKVLAIDFLTHSEMNTANDQRSIRDLGDHCLVLSGLFPERIVKKNISLNYVIGIGKQSYRLLSTANSPSVKYIDKKLFSHLDMNFVGLMDLLNHIRLDAYSHSI